jgi:2,5-diamino-6-(ribosylamino)-4(3H)-pyrimidinone 5'-phosphate reductase
VLVEGEYEATGAFLEAGLVDEVSLLLVPGIDGRSGIPTVFDGLGAGPGAAVPLQLQSVQRRAGDALWLRYLVARR